MFDVCIHVGTQGATHTTWYWWRGIRRHVCVQVYAVFQFNRNTFHVMASVERIYQLNCFLKHLLFWLLRSLCRHNGLHRFHECSCNRDTKFGVRTWTHVWMCRCSYVRSMPDVWNRLFLNEFSVFIIFRSPLPRNIYICAIPFRPNMYFIRSRQCIAIPIRSI